jgi:hypothetical protein
MVVFSIYCIFGGRPHWLEHELFKSHAAHFPFFDLLINFTKAQLAYPKIATPITILAIICPTSFSNYTSPISLPP